MERVDHLDGGIEGKRAAVRFQAPQFGLAPERVCFQPREPVAVLVCEVIRYPRLCCTNKRLSVGIQRRCEPPGKVNAGQFACNVSEERWEGPFRTEPVPDAPGHLHHPDADVGLVVVEIGDQLFKRVGFAGGSLGAGTSQLPG